METNPELLELKTQVQTLQSEMLALKSTWLPNIQETVNELANDLKNKNTMLGTHFDRLEGLLTSLLYRNARPVCDVSLLNDQSDTESMEVASASSRGAAQPPRKSSQNLAYAPGTTNETKTHHNPKR